jgi:hypothetical protein
MLKVDAHTASPLQPVNVEPEAAVAIKVTVWPGW